MTTLPWEPDPANPNRVVVKYPAATDLLNQLTNFKPPPPFIPIILNPHTIRVRVVNGSGVPGIAGRVLNSLVAAGFRSAGPAEDADRSDYARTQIRWSPGLYSKGVTAVYATGAKDFASAATKADTLGADILVVVGRDWKTLTHHLTNLPGTKRVTPATPSDDDHHHDEAAADDHVDGRPSIHSGRSQDRRRARRLPEALTVGHRRRSGSPVPWGARPRTAVIAGGRHEAIGEPAGLRSVGGLRGSCGERPDRAQRGRIVVLADIGRRGRRVPHVRTVDEWRGALLGRQQRRSARQRHAHELDDSGRGDRPDGSTADRRRSVPHVRAVDRRHRRMLG